MKYILLAKSSDGSPLGQASSENVNLIRLFGEQVVGLGHSIAWVLVRNIGEEHQFTWEQFLDYASKKAAEAK